MCFVLRYKRLFSLLLLVAVWCFVGFAAHKWEVFEMMIIPVCSAFGVFMGAESLKPSNNRENSVYEKQEIVETNL